MTTIEYQGLHKGVHVFYDRIIRIWFTVSEGDELSQSQREAIERYEAQKAESEE